MRPARALALAVAGAAGAVAVALPAAARADEAVGIPGKFFDPPRVTLLVGESVSWHNSDFVTHDVRARDGAFDSGVLAHLAVFSQRFDTPGAHPYFCTIHPFMTGQVDVAAATLRGPAGPVFAGEAARLDGRAPAGTAVRLERSGPGGTWEDAGAAPATAGADGAFAFTVRPAATASYRAATAQGASAPVSVPVAAHVSVTTRVRRAGGHVVVRVATKPPRAGLVAVLERYDRWHFVFRRGAHARLDRAGRASFSLPAGARGQARIVLARTARGAALATGDPVRLQDGRPGGGVPVGGELGGMPAAGGHAGM